MANLGRALAWVIVAAVLGLAACYAFYGTMIYLAVHCASPTGCHWR